MSRWGGRFAPNHENELRKLVKEPVQTWKREWVQPDPNKPFKVLKYVKTGLSIDFSTQAALEAERAGGEQDDEPEPVPEVEADDNQEQEQDDDDEDRDDDDEEGEQTSGAAALNAADPAPASALPAHMQAEAAAASAEAALMDTSTASSSASPTSSAPSPAGAQLEAAIVNVAAGIPATAAAALSGPSATADATGSELVGGGGVQVASELNPPPDGALAPASAPVTVTSLDDDDVAAGDAAKAGEGSGDGSAVPTRQEVRSVAGVGTEVLVQAYTDRILVLATQMGRVGCLIQATTTAPANYVHTSAAGSRPLFGDGDDFDYPDAAAGDVPVSAYLEVPTTKSGANLPNPLPNTSLLSLFGTPPAGQETLFSLYVSQIAAIVFTRTGLPPSGDDVTVQQSAPAFLAQPQEPDPRPVIVGLALKRMHSGDEHSAQEEDDVFGEGERARFLEIMDMVLACRLW